MENKMTEICFSNCRNCGEVSTGDPVVKCGICGSLLVDRKYSHTVNLPVSLGWTREEIRECRPGLSERQIDAICSTAYELQVSFDLKLGKFVSVETVTHYARVRAMCSYPEMRNLAGCEDCSSWEGCTAEKVRF